VSNHYKKYVLSIKPGVKIVGRLRKYVVFHPEQDFCKCIGLAKTERNAWKDAALSVMLNKPEKDTNEYT
jgi:hypothetical protein